MVALNTSDGPESQYTELCCLREKPMGVQAPALLSRTALQSAEPKSEPCSRPKRATQVLFSRSRVPSTPIQAGQVPTKVQKANSDCSSNLDSRQPEALRAHRVVETLPALREAPAGGCERPREAEAGRGLQLDTESSTPTSGGFCPQVTGSLPKLPSALRIPNLAGPLLGSPLNVQ